jgi:dihydroneopterin aldolase
MLGKILLHNLKVTCIVGIHPGERQLPQNLWLDVSLTTGFADSIASENIADTIDYSEIADCLEQWIMDKQFQLIETLAVEACHLLFSKWPTIKSCKILVKKPAAVPHADYAGVEVELHNANSTTESEA